MMIAEENFWEEPKGWNINKTTKCGSVFMLGGYGVLASQRLEKTFEEEFRDPHKTSASHTTVRITGEFHFIDAWSGETAFIQLKETEEYLWTTNYDLSKTKNGINVCGSDYAEAQLSVHFDFTIPHQKYSLTLVFGTTLENDPYENSYGISNLRIYVR